MKKRVVTVAGLSIALAFSMVGCSGTTTTTSSSSSSASSAVTAQADLDLSGNRLTDSDITTSSSYENSADGEHAITADGETAEYKNFTVNKIGEADGDEADFYGENAAVFATNSATLNLSDAIVTTNGKHANGVFSYGTGTTVNISHSIIRTTGNCSGGIMTTGGGTMNATDVTAETTGNSSAAIRSDRGGGTVTVNGGYFTTAGTGSPVVYSTADITVNDAYMASTASQGVVVEGKNSVTLNGCQLIADNNKKNSDKSDTYQAVMIYQSMSGDASVGTSSFTMNGGTLTNANGDIFFVNNTACTISLSGATITNNDATGVFLRAEAAGWGSTGSNGGKINLNATGQVINGDMLVDSVSTLNLSLASGSTFTGAINSTGANGNVYVELDANSTWTLTADSYVSSLTCDAGSINLNGHKLYVDGKEYTASSASTGTAFEIVSSSSTSGNGGGAGGEGGEAPDKPGEGGGEGGQGGDVPDKPDGEGDGAGGGDGATPPSKPE